MKAFPLVCVCLPDHWQKTIENEVQQLSEGDFNSGSENGFASSTTHSYKSSKEKGTRSQPSGSSP